LRPNGSVGCFNVLEGADVLHTVEVKVQGIKSTCQSHTHFYARDYDLQHQYSLRCAGAGSCVSAKCSKTTLQDTIEELSLDSRKSPGFTECFEGCGCVTCGGCFRCDSSCLFNRFYATTVDVTISIGSKVWNVGIHHGIPYKIPSTNVSVTITGFSTPPSPIHGATFIKRTDNSGREAFGYSQTTVASSGYPSKGLIGELQCATMDDASQFNCQFDKSLCTCMGQGTYVDCLCKRISLEDIVKRTSLPRRETDTIIRVHEGAVTTSAATTALVSLQLNFANQIIRRAAREGACKAASQEVVGCYSYSEGATAKTGVINEVFLYTSSADLNWDCEVSCGNGSSSITMRGQLQDQLRFEKKEYGTDREQSVIFDSIGTHLANAVTTVFGGLLK
ncbi:Protein CBG06517, partial [Caenorhabditis briggsae]